jgi:hypothetical protein
MKGLFLIGTMLIGIWAVAQTSVGSSSPNPGSNGGSDVPSSQPGGSRGDVNNSTGPFQNTGNGSAGTYRSGINSGTSSPGKLGTYGSSGSSGSGVPANGNGSPGKGVGGAIGVSGTNSGVINTHSPQSTGGAPTGSRGASGTTTHPSTPYGVGPNYMDNPH